MNDQDGAPAADRRVRYEGNGAVLWGIALGNLALNILTLGFWRFWGAVRVRRHLWSHVRFEGDAFEYAGTGGELFRGFILAILVFGVPFAVLSGLGEYFEVRHETAVASLCYTLASGTVFLLGAAAIFRARRYRLSRTHWRGIRGGLTGSAWIYVGRWLLTSAANIASLGLAYPWTRVYLLKYLWNNSQFGDRSWSLNLVAGPLFRRWVLCWGLAPFAAVSGIVLFGLFIGGEVTLPAEDLGAVVGRWTWLLQVVCVVMMAALPCAYFWYKTAELRALAGGLTWDGLRFRLDLSVPRLMWVGLSNMVIVLGTLGIGVPYALHRWFRLISGHLSVEGAVDFAAILQNQAQRPSHGEGLATLLDVE